MTTTSSLASLDQRGRDESIDFLRRQTLAVLSHHQDARAADVHPAVVTIPFVPSRVITTPESSVVRWDLLDRAQAALRQHVEALSGRGSGDAHRTAVAERVRQFLESLYGAPLTFQGETRPTVPTTLSVEQKIEVLLGEAIGIELDASTAETTSAHVSQDVGEVGGDGSLIGIRVTRDDG